MRSRGRSLIALIRFCYNQSAIAPEYNHITFAIFGAVTLSDSSGDRSTPFNIAPLNEWYNPWEASRFYQGNLRLTEHQCLFTKDVIEKSLI